MAPATKYGGKIVACQPGSTDTAKSKLTIVCTETTRSVAKSGIRPTNQNSNDTVRYVDTAKTSQMSGLRNCGHTPIVFGYGKSQYAASHGRPVWTSGKIAAQAT